MSSEPSQDAGRSGKKVEIPEQLKCTIDRTVEAVILYPSLGMPMVLGPEQKVCSLIIATKEKCWKIEDEDAHEYIDRHLRLTAMDQPKHTFAKDTECGELCGDGTRYNFAKRAFKVWSLGSMKDDRVIVNHHGSPIAVLAAGLTCGEGPYADLKELWEVEINLKEAGLEGRITDKEFLNWAWLVKTTDEHRKENRQRNIRPLWDYHEPQDRMIDSYLGKLSDLGTPLGKAQRHYDRAHQYEVELPKGEVKLPKDGGKYPMPLGVAEEAKRLQSWHPVIQATELPLKLAHLSDLHVNVRQGALAKSKACVIENVSKEPVGRKVAHTFWSVRELIGQMAGKKRGVDTALLLTGDYIDFNRNIDPGAVGDEIGEQWKNFNVLAKIDDDTLYRRGFDDTLMYSLVREAYTKHKMPVFMVNGNHEAYQFPYGISPRTAVPLGWAPTLKSIEGDLKKKEEALKACQDQLKKIMAQRTEKQVFRSTVVNRERFLRKEIEEQRKKLEAHRKKWEEASEWKNNRANEGIPADHNLTIYEATLAYGPTYGQVWTTYNFSADQFDWFHTLFTPFSDAALFLGAEADKSDGKAGQILTLLGWGGGERFFEVLNAASKATGKGIGADQRGPGFLPYATESIDKGQVRLLEHVKRRKFISQAPSIVASHFTIFNYDAGKAFSEEGSFIPYDEPESGPMTVRDGSAQYNKFNFGSCERRVRTYVNGYVSARTADSKSMGVVDWHFSGHSHRAGIYDFRREGDKVVCTAWDPGLFGGAAAGTVIRIERPGTQFIVSSSAGPLGVQNLAGELSGWTPRPPSGTLVDVGKRDVCQIQASREEWNEAPRLCVALDYLHVMYHEALSHGYSEPLVFKGQKTKDVGKSGFSHVTITLSGQVQNLECLEMKQMSVWVFQDEGMDGNRKPKGTWRLIKPDMKPGKKGRYILSFDKETEDVLKASMERGKDGWICKTIAAFCVIPLRRPDTAWARDMKMDDWVFPLEIGLKEVVDIDERDKSSVYVQTVFCRPDGEKGEVPDWEFRAKYFERLGKGYIPEKVAILDEEIEETSGSDTSAPL